RLGAAFEREIALRRAVLEPKLRWVAAAADRAGVADQGDMTAGAQGGPCRRRILRGGGRHEARHREARHDEQGRPETHRHRRQEAAPCKSYPVRNAAVITTASRPVDHALVV